MQVIDADALHNLHTLHNINYYSSILLLADPNNYADMSAFAALQGLESASSLLSKESESDNDVISYQPNSSDDDGDEDETEAQRPRRKLSTLSASLESNAYSQVVSSSNARKIMPYAFYSNFTPNKNNYVVINQNQVLVGLKQLEFILVNGQAKMTIQRGAILVNNCHYLFARPDFGYNIIASQSQSLPIIASAQVRDRSCGIVDQRTPENDHLFHSDYKSVVILEGISSGLQNIGSYYAPLKRFMYNTEEPEETAGSPPLGPAKCISDHPDYQLIKEMPFEIVLENKGLVGLQIEGNWSNIINDIINNPSYGLNQKPSVTMVIGNKNSGKSTFSKSLLNDIILSGGNEAVTYLDLDPGQSEFSVPYCLSITTQKSPIIGLNIGGAHSSSEINSTEYYGFTTPQLNPKLYISLVKKLWNFYLVHHQPLGHHLVINTPGWIKGLGKQLLEEITSFVQPQHMVYLNGLGRLDDQDSVTLENLTFERLHVAPGMYQVSKYSPAQLRNFNKLAYFHKKSKEQFDFINHTLNSPPVKVSYQTSVADYGFQGVNGISIVNYDTPLQFNYEDLMVMIDTSIVGVYLVENETFHASVSKFYALGSDDSPRLPLYINSTDLYRDVIDETPNSIFLGLCMIHSVNALQGYLNLYFPSHSGILAEIQHKVTNGGYKMVLVKGEGEIPNPEILMPQLVLEEVSLLKKMSKKQRQEKLSKPILKGNMPYVNFAASGSKIGGVWKVRRNIMRRSHKQ